MCQRLAALGRRPDVELQVVAPVPVFPILSRLKQAPVPAVDMIQGLTVHYPTYFYFPTILKSLDGWFYGHGLRNRMEERCR